MSERLTPSPTAEERVFGGIYNLTEFVPLDRGVTIDFFKERLAAIEAGETVWLPRTLGSELGVVADLRNTDGIVAMLEFDYEERAATVYVTSPGGEFGDTVIADRVPFEEAVVAAEHYAS